MHNRWKIKAAAGLLSCGFFLFSGDVTSDFLPQEKNKILLFHDSSSGEKEKELTSGYRDYALLFTRLANKDPRKSISSEDRKALFAILEKTPESSFLVMNLVLEYKKLPGKKEKMLFSDELGKIASAHPGAFALICIVSDMYQEEGRKEKSEKILEKSISYFLEKINEEEKAEVAKSTLKEYILYLFRSYARLLTEKKAYAKSVEYLEKVFENALLKDDLILLQFAVYNSYFLLLNADDKRENPLLFWQKTHKEEAEAAFEQSVKNYQEAVRKLHWKGESIQLGRHRTVLRIFSEREKYKELPLALFLSEHLAGNTALRPSLLFLADHFALKRDEATSARIWKRLLENPVFPVNGTPFMIHALKFLRSGNHAEAIKAQELACISEPHHAPAAFTLARLYMQAGKKEAAYKILEAFFPDPEALNMAASFRMIEQETAKALSLYLQLDNLMAETRFPVKRGGKNKVPLTANGEELVRFVSRQIQIAFCAEKLSLFPLMEKHLKKCLAADPGNAVAANFLGYSLADRNKELDFAETLISIALEKEAANYAYLDSLAWVKFRKKEYKEAEKYILKAIEKAGKNVDVVLYDHAGDISCALKKKEQAIQYWHKALNTYSSELDAAKIVQKIEKTKKELAAK